MPLAAVDYLPLLRQGRWFARLPVQVQAAFVDGVRVCALPAGTRLFARGDANDGLYCIVDGAVRLGAVDADGRETVLGVIEPPQWFGEIALFDAGPRTHNAQLHQAGILLHLPLAALETMLAREPLLWRDLGALVVEKVRALMVGFEQLASLPAPARLARRLLAMSEGHGMLAQGHSRRMVAVNQEQLGTMLAMSRQTVGEVLKDFEARALVKRRYGAIEVLDPAGLAHAGEAV